MKFKKKTLHVEMEGSLFGKRRFQSLDYSFHSSFELSNKSQEEK